MRSQLRKVGVLVVLLSSLSSQIGFAADRKNSSDIGKKQSGIASIYDRSSGKDTASGESLNESAHAAAHRSLPLNTVVEVTNNRTGQKTLVRINDRGPFANGRIIDLTPAAARALGVDGLARVSLEVVSLPDEH
jgi:peptidoglycan lytic transglycosylase